MRHNISDHGSYNSFGQTNAEAPQQKNAPESRSFGWTLGVFRNMTIGVHWSLFVFGFLAIANLAGVILPTFVPGYSSTVYLAVAALGTLGLFGSILLHELGHAIVAQRADVEVDGITLWLLGGVARLKSEAQTAGDAFRIAAAGPAVSVALAVLGGAAAGVLQLGGASSIVVALFGYLGLINLGLAVFNLIPALPLDGGRIAQAYLWHRDGNRHDATISAAKLGHSIGWVGVGLGLVQLFAGVGSGLWTILIAWFVMRGATGERKAAEREKRKEMNPPIWPNFFDRFDQGSGPGTPQSPNRHPWLGEPIPVKSWEENHR